MAVVGHFFEEMVVLFIYFFFSVILCLVGVNDACPLVLLVGVRSFVGFMGVFCRGDLLFSVLLKPNSFLV